MASEGREREKELFDELCFYTLGHGDPAFIHQLVVDAYTAQHAGENTKTLAIVFALIGLYLHLEKGFTGKQVQRAHMQLARFRREWPRPALPAGEAALRVGDVMATAPGAERDAMIERWCAAVWEVWQEARGQMVEMARKELGVEGQGSWH
jgi:hypothetical protein